MTLHPHGITLKQSKGGMARTVFESVGNTPAQHDENDNCTLPQSFHASAPAQLTNNGEAELRNALEAESMVLRCAHELYRVCDIDSAADIMLSTLGAYFQADRTYLMRFHGDLMSNTHEWCAPGVIPYKESLQGVTRSIVERWAPFLENGECLIIENVPALPLGSADREALTAQSIDSVAAAPLERDGKVVGFLGIDNPARSLVRNVSSPLKTLAYFFMMTERRIETERRLTLMSYHDELTGLYNRNRYLVDLEHLKKAKEGSLGIAFVDVNDLKETNDVYGHACGDEVLVACAATLADALPGADLYRIGGDEFVALVRNVDEASFSRMTSALERAFPCTTEDEVPGGDRVAIGAQWSARPSDVSALLAAADAEMYARKRRYHLEKALSGRLLQVVGDETPDHVTASVSLGDVARLEREQAATYDNLPGFVARYRVSPQGLKLLYGNERFVDFFGAVDDPLTAKLFQKNLDFNADVVKQFFSRILRGESVSFDVEAISRANEKASFRVYADCVDWIEGDPVYLVLYLDTTETERQRRRAEEAAERLRTLAYVDSVTGGRNRTSFEADAGAAVKAAPPGTYALVALDVDKFKVVNDQFGLDAGDAVLCAVHESIDARLGEGELAARISADLFNLLVKADQAERVVARVEEVAAAANAGLTLGNAQAYLLTLTAGIYVVDDPALPMMQIQDRANVALSKASSGVRTGRLSSCRFYNNEDRVRLAHEKDVEGRMRAALEAGEFIVYLQPKLDLRRGVIAGAEALVRWRDPERGLVPPNDFIPLFERNGFIVELDLYVFEQVCLLLHDWLVARRRPVPVSVNLSRVHLRDPHFLNRFEEVRHRCGVPASLIEFELTETLVFDNPQLLTHVIDAIHRAGYTCSLDDFGSGYSSLNVLKNLEVDTLKLDRVFFDDAGVDEDGGRGADIVSVVIDLARRLNMKTVAEGVETDEQRRFLEEAGCDLLQGFLFAKPLPPDAFERLAFGPESSERGSEISCA